MPGNLNNLRNFILAQQLDRGPDFTQEHQRGKVYNTPGLDDRRMRRMQDSFRAQSGQNSVGEIGNRKRDKWLYENSPNATPEDLKEFGLNPQGQRLDGKSFTAPFSQGDMWKDLEQYGLSPSNAPQQLSPHQIQGLHQLIQEQDLNKVRQQQQQQQRSYTRPFEAPTQNQLNNYKQNHPMNRMWDELKNYR
jgi:hypothetical protein